MQILLVVVEVAEMTITDEQLADILRKPHRLVLEKTPEELNALCIQLGTALREEREQHKRHRANCEGVISAGMDALDAARARIAELELRLRNDTEAGRSLAQAYNDMEDANEQLERRIAELEGALEFYGDPETYFAIGVIPDPPCGAFIYDLEETDEGLKPGLRARAVLARKEESAS